MTFMEKLRNRWHKSGSMLCVGLDPELSKMPACLGADKDRIFEFNRAIIDATHDLVCAYKPQAAYYAGQDADDQLAKTIDYIHENYPEVPVILDVKRGDIGATARMYAKEAFDRYAADALTVNPYMGTDTLEVFLERADKGVIVLCRTSNPGSGDFQSLTMESGKPLYLEVAERAASKWNGNGNVGLVVGATYPEELARVRRAVGDLFLLVPGVGAQGGSVAKVLANGCDSTGYGLVINSSRGIIYASKESDFAERSRMAAEQLCAEIAAARKAQSC